MPKPILWTPSKRILRSSAGAVLRGNPLLCGCCAPPSLPCAICVPPCLLVPPTDPTYCGDLGDVTALCDPLLFPNSCCTPGSAGQDQFTWADNPVAWVYCNFQAKWINDPAGNSVPGCEGVDACTVKTGFTQAGGVRTFGLNDMGLPADIEAATASCYFAAAQVRFPGLTTLVRQNCPSNPMETLAADIVLRAEANVSSSAGLGGGDGLFGDLTANNYIETNQCAGTLFKNHTHPFLLFDNPAAWDADFGISNGMAWGIFRAQDAGSYTFGGGDQCHGQYQYFMDYRFVFAPFFECPNFADPFCALRECEIGWPGGFDDLEPFDPGDPGDPPDPPSPLECNPLLGANGGCPGTCRCVGGHCIKRIPVSLPCTTIGVEIPCALSDITAGPIPVTYKGIDFVVVPSSGGFYVPIGPLSGTVICQLLIAIGNGASAAQALASLGLENVNPWSPIVGSPGTVLPGNFFAPRLASGGVSNCDGCKDLAGLPQRGFVL